jgi:uncharacterized RDD family membrane protein YckC
VLVPATVSGATFSMLLYFSARFLVAAMGLTLLAIGHLIAGFRQDKRALHDMVVGSRVMKQATPKPQE